MNQLNQRYRFLLFRICKRIFHAVYHPFIILGFFSLYIKTFLLFKIGMDTLFKKFPILFCPFFFNTNIFNIESQSVAFFQSKEGKIYEYFPNTKQNVSLNQQKYLQKEK